MSKHLRRLEISLAAKCQLLFGAAVVLIIAAALFVPWQRVEQLMHELNIRAASVLADRAEMDHVLYYSALYEAPRSGGPSTLPTTWPAPMAATQPTTQPVEEGSVLLPPRLLGRAQAKEFGTRFERGAMARFIDDADKPLHDMLYTRKDGGDGYRFARPAYLHAECYSCHSEAAGVLTTLARAATRPASQPATRPTTQMARRDNPLVGIVSVDMRSQIDANQILLNRVFLLTAGLLAGTLAIIVFYLITTRLILQPVRVLQETAEKVAQGDLNIRSDISTGDEFQQLSETFNTMLANLKQSEDRLRAINKNLDLKLNELAESNVALYESNRLKSEFLANVSHELRTPLNSILGFAELLRDAVPTAGDGKSGRYVQNILSSGRNLLALVTELLDLAKIEAGRMEVRSEPLSLTDLFEGLANILKPLAEPKKLTIEAQVAPDVPILQTDPAKLQQILYNFLSNAIKFSPNEGRIEVVAERQGEQRVRLSVTDHGPGIIPEQQETIFEKFRQLDGSVTRQHGGTGLGLAISRELVQLLGGTIGVDSTQGHGATFWVILPIKIDASTQDVRGKAPIG